MMNNESIPDDRKINVQYRVEAGCLGPTGSELVEDFCQFAQTRFNKIDDQFVQWNIIPRFDKSLPELQYRLNNKLLTREQCEKYLSLFQRSLSEFEEQIDEQLVIMIEQFMDSR